MDPEIQQAAAAAPSADSAAPMPAQGGGGDDAPEDEGSPLSHIDIDPAENGASIVTITPASPPA